MDQQLRLLFQGTKVVPNTITGCLRTITTPPGDSIPSANSLGHPNAWGRHMYSGKMGGGGVIHRVELSLAIKKKN